MILGAATINTVAIGIPQKSKKFIDFTIASFKVSSEELESFEKTGYMMVPTIRPGKKTIVSKRRYPAPYHPITAVLVIRESRKVSMR